MGHDWGGAVAAVYALHYRQEVRRLTFIESALGGAGFENAWVFNAPNPKLTFIPFLLAENLSEELAGERRSGCATYGRHLPTTRPRHHLPNGGHIWKRCNDQGFSARAGEYYRAVYGAAERVRDLVAAGKLTIPVLSVSGEASFGAAQLTFVEAFAGNIARHVVIPGSGHFVPEEQPQALLTELKKFMGV